MQGRFESENPYTQRAIQTMDFVRSDPANQHIYAQTAAAYAAIAQAIELEYLNTVFENVGALLATGSFELDNIVHAIRALDRETE